MFSGYRTTPLEDWVTAFYKRISIQKPSDLQIDIITEQCDVILIIDGAESSYIITDLFQIITVDSRLSPEKQKETFFHELCHILRHEGMQGKMPRMFREWQEWDIDALQEQQGRLEKEKEAFGAGYNDLDLVCPNSFGEPCKFRNLTELWKKAIKRSGVPDIRFHDLRHTHATLMLKQGVHPKIVSERLGHSRVGVTLDTYSHVVPGLQKEAVEKFADHLFSKKK